jgi:hypothetical protein
MAGRPDDFGTAEGAAEEPRKQTPHGLKARFVITRNKEL